MTPQEPWVLLQEIASETEARLLQGYLESAGIACEVESMVYHAEPVTFGQLSRVRLWVLADELEAAQALLRDAESGAAQTTPAAADDAREPAPD